MVSSIMGVGVGLPGARGRKVGVGVNSAKGVGRLCADSSEEVDRRSLPCSVHFSNFHCWQLVRGHELATCPTLLHPWHTTWTPGTSGGSSTPSTLTVLFSTNSSDAGIYRRWLFKIRPNILIGLQKLRLRPKDRSRLFIIFAVSRTGTVGSTEH